MESNATHVRASGQPRHALPSMSIARVATPHPVDSASCAGSPILVRAAAQKGQLQASRHQCDGFRRVTKLPA
eukprot:2573819-Pleurochrysis_carterae.AAC.4